MIKINSVPVLVLNLSLIQQVLVLLCLQYLYMYKKKLRITDALGRAEDPHSFFVDPDPAVFLNADLDPAALKSESRLNKFVKKNLMKSFL